MKRLMIGALLCIGAILKVSAQVEIVPGVSWELAQFRAKHVKDVMYFLDFHIPDKMEERVSGTANIYFQYDGGESLQLDFQGVVEEPIQVNGKEVKAYYEQEHIVVAKEDLQLGQNNISVRFTSEDKALNRSADYLYTLFVPDHARSVFPCFDQPDLKGRYKLTLQLPDSWRAISNGRAEEHHDAQTGVADGQRSLPTRTATIPQHLRVWQRHLGPPDSNTPRGGTSSPHPGLRPTMGEAERYPHADAGPKCRRTA